jgi:hypothetical protein
LSLISVTNMTSAMPPPFLKPWFKIVKKQDLREEQTSKFWRLSTLKSSEYDSPANIEKEYIMMHTKMIVLIS